MSAAAETLSAERHLFTIFARRRAATLTRVRDIAKNAWLRKRTARSLRGEKRQHAAAAAAR